MGFQRTFIHVDDAISGYMFALDNASKMAGEVYNVGGNNLNHSKLDIANTIKKYVDYEIIDSTLPDLDVRDFLVSFDKISKVGFTPKLSLDDGINELVKLTSNFTGSDIIGLCSRASLAAAARDRNIPSITMKDFYHVLKTMTSSVKISDIQRLQQWKVNV